MKLDRLHPEDADLDYMVVAALTQADTYIDYSIYDKDGDGYVTGKELQLLFIVAGYEGSYPQCPETTCHSIWAHQSYLYYDTTKLDGKWLAQNSNDDDYGGYAAVGERHGSHIAQMGTPIHELGHLLSWPDLYDTSQLSEGVGEWSIMGSGSWNEISLPGDSPALPDAWSKWYQGWLTPTPASTNNNYSLTTAATNAQALLMGSNPNGVDWDFYRHSGSGEYWLIENREKSGYDQALPGCGLLIWHIDETVTSTNLANANRDDALVELEQADGAAHLNSTLYSNRGDAGDPYPGTKPNYTFSSYSNPSSKTNAGQFSGHSVTVNSGSCQASMSLTYSYSGDPTFTNRVFLPVVQTPERPFSGQVLYDFTPVSGQPVWITYSTDNGSTWTSKYAQTTTDANGYFTFASTPPVGSGKMFEVYWENPNIGATNPSSTWTKYLWAFYCNPVEATTDVYTCTMNIRDVALVSPNNNVTVGMPVTFTWKKRATPTDNYRWYMSDWYTGHYWWSYLYYTDRISFSNMTGINLMTNYRYYWRMDVLTPDGYGIGYYDRGITFANLGSPALSSDQLSPLASSSFTEPPEVRWLQAQGVLNKQLEP